MQVWTYNVLPKLPDRLAPLREIAYNLWFSWNWEAVELFMRLGGDYWGQSYQNPVRMLGMIPQKRYEDMLKNKSFLASMDRVYEHFTSYMNAETWFMKNHGDTKGTVAYFSCEYGLDEGLPVYSGGLGILSGDHMKSASDLGLPLVGVGLLYKEGYFRQYLNADGYQQEQYPVNDWYTMPVSLVNDKSGKPLKVKVDFPAGEVITAHVWGVNIGRVTLYLLDTNLPENPQHHRDITAQLYGGDRDMRVRQELVLGIGGLRALWAMGIEPSVCHMNEGHSAFLIFERLAKHMREDGLSFAEASELVYASNVFTTHTPVPAGNERFDPALLQKYLQPYLGAMKLSWDECLALGREVPSNHQEPFCMTVLALKLAAHSNGVAKLHGDVSRDMWKSLWPTLPAQEVPIGHVTNGIHSRGWLSHDMHSLFDRYLGPNFVEEPTDFEVFKRIDDIPDAEIWRTHERRRERLVAFARHRMVKRLRERGAPPREIALAEEVLDPEALTIGFARRFATYKRGTLLFTDPERLVRLLSIQNRPVQLIFAGKSHPHDEPGKALIRELVHQSRQDKFLRKIVFIEDYDITVARYLTQGVDVWLNTPRRPLEASGTSGMKAAVNGVLNCSILDGWWDEGYTPDVGWAIGNREIYSDPVQQDRVESNALYELLEQDIIPLFFQRGKDGLPREWIRRMKASMRDLGAFFNTGRMLMEYWEKLYSGANAKYHDLAANGATRARQLAAWKKRVAHEWGSVSVVSVHADTADMAVGQCLKVHATVALGGLSPNDVDVQLYSGVVHSDGHLDNPSMTPMRLTGSPNGQHAYEGCIDCGISGRFGFTIRILPKNADLCHQYLSGIIRWA